MTSPIIIARTPEDILRCLEVMQELRTTLQPDEFLTKVQTQQREDGYELVFLEAGDEVRAVAGYRIANSLAWGRFLYVDDLVTRSSDRSHGYGSALFAWLIDRARLERCDQFHLDSGVQRFDAHRFYRRKGLEITSHHFALRLEAHNGSLV